MSIKVQCPQCREKYNAGNEYLGRRFRCRCGAVIAVPDLDEILNAPDAFGEIPNRATSVDTELPFPKAPRPTLYGLFALTSGTTGTLAGLGFLIVSVAAYTSPIFNTPREDAYAAAGSFAVSLLAFFAAAVFRIADLTVRRSGSVYFF